MSSKGKRVNTYWMIKKKDSIVPIKVEGDAMRRAEIAMTQTAQQRLSRSTVARNETRRSSQLE